MDSMHHTNYQYIHANWQLHKAKLREVREAVFIKEQSVPLELEWDEFDHTAEHILVLDGEYAIATGRLCHDGSIGRMAVLKSYRKQGIGGQILNNLLTLAKEKSFNQVSLHAQTHAIDFYKKFGFISEGNEFLEANIPHYLMRLSFNN